MTTPILDKENVLVIMPAFNEEASISRVLEQLLRIDYRVLVVNDGSVDKTSLVAREAGAEVLELCLNLGVGGALRAGFQFAIRKNYRAVVQFDADGQHPTERIKDLIETANKTRADLVVGSRFRDQRSTMKVSYSRRMIMRLLARSASRAVGSPITDATSGFRLIQGNLLAQFSQVFPSNYLGDTYEAMVSAGRADYSVVEIPTRMSDRLHGESSASPGQAIKFIIKGLLVAGLRLHSPITNKL